jgi:hypothetical protein
MSAAEGIESQERIERQKCHNPSNPLEIGKNKICEIRETCVRKNLQEARNLRPAAEITGNFS